MKKKDLIISLVFVSELYLKKQKKNSAMYIVVDKLWYTEIFGYIFWKFYWLCILIDSLFKFASAESSMFDYYFHLILNLIFFGISTLEAENKSIKKVLIYLFILTI